MQTRLINGGLMDIDDALTALRSKRGKQGKQVSKDDIERAVKQLQSLGSGFQIVRMGARKMLQSVPYQLSQDHTAVIELAQGKSFVTSAQLIEELHWSIPRCDLVLGQLLEEGMAWVDFDPETQQKSYWFPTLCFGSGLAISQNAT